MKAGTENRRKTIIAGGVASAALIYFIYFVYGAFFSGPSTAVPAPTVASTPAVNAPAATKTTAASSTNGKQNAQGGSVAGVAATKLATTSSSLDPTLDETAMLRTESLVYTGTGRNIFSLVYTPPVVIPKAVASARPAPTPPPAPTGPPPIPPPPPINLKFFGTVKRGSSKMQAFLLEGEDVYLAGEGDIVARKYKIVKISASTIQVTDLQNDNTQTLPLQTN
jgi:hypothetical protein